MSHISSHDVTHSLPHTDVSVDSTDFHDDDEEEEHDEGPTTFVEGAHEFLKSPLADRLK